MRTLKKALSLVLVLAMVFTLAVPALAVDKKGSDFTDYDKIENKEAVDVLTAIGVLNGNPDGTFGAEGTFTRAQAATMITYLTLGKTVADALPVTGTGFSDVPASFWGAKYIAYCAQEGIISGMGDGKFAPDAKLTAAQWSLMLLGALGYNAKNEGIGGTGWEITATKLAMQAGVASAEDLTAAFNRDMAAKMAFNTLTADVVEYEDNGTNITVGDTVINVGAKKAKTVAAVKDSDGKEVNYNGTNGTGDGKAQFCEVHFPTLKKVADATKDPYGRPGATWTYGKTNAQIGIYSTATPVATYTTAVSTDDLYKTLGANAVLLKNGSTVTYGGARANNYIIGNAKGGSANQEAATDNIAVKGEKVYVGGAGIITEIYATDTANEYIVVQIQPQLAQVNTITNTSATKKEGAYTTYSFSDIVPTGKLYTTTVTDSDRSTIVIDGTIAKKDWVMVYGLGTADCPLTVVPATIVTGKMTGYTSATNSYTIDGESYPMSAAAGSKTPTAYNSTNSYAIDAYGNVVAAVTVETANNFVYVLDAKKVAILNTDTNVIDEVIQATTITTDGTLSTAIISKVNNADATAENTNGGLYTYVVDNNGKYVLSGANGDGKATVSTIEKNNPVLNSTNNKYANANTKYFVAQYDSTNKKYTGVTTYTGYASVPSLTLTNGARLVDANNDGIAEIVFVSPTSETVTDTLAYVTGSFSSDGTTYTYDVIVKGEPTTMKLQSALTADLYNVKNGKAEAATTVETYLTYNGGVLMSAANVNADETIGLTYDSKTFKTVGADVPVYTFENGACTTSTAADLSTTGSAKVAVAYSTSAGVDTITAIYIVK